jgi:pimeloyl-ACP methyl ester carboxylesterase
MIPNRVLKTFCLGVLLTAVSVSTSSAQTEQMLCGDYVFSDGSIVTVLKVELGLAFFNFETGRFGVLHKDQSRPFTYFAGPGAIGKDPREIEIKFHGNGSQIKRLTYRDLLGNSAKSGNKNAPFREEEATISYDQVSLKATISYPHSKGPWPAITLNHGGGPGPRAALKVWANMYNRLGYACLVYDKRDKGPRESKGPDWVTFEDLANDAIAAIEYLRAKKNIDASKIGLATFSQGGWVATIAAGKDKQISFLIMISCPVISPAERDALSSIMRLRTDGFSEADISEAQDFTTAFNAVGKGLIPWSEYESRLKTVRGQKWFSYVEFVSKHESLASDYYKSLYGRYYEPANDLKQISIPVLAIYGQNDKTVPPDENAKKAYLYLRDNRHSFVLVLPTANHSLIESKTGSDSELVLLNTYSKQYFDLIKIWLNALN